MMTLWGFFKISVKSRICVQEQRSAAEIDLELFPEWAEGLLSFLSEGGVGAAVGFHLQF